MKRVELNSTLCQGNEIPPGYKSPFGNKSLWNKTLFGIKSLGNKSPFQLVGYQTSRNESLEIKSPGKQNPSALFTFFMSHLRLHAYDLGISSIWTS